MSWTRALHLKHWADTREAQGLLPLLLRRLIRATVPAHALVNFPAREQVGRPGLDGVVTTSANVQYVPPGDSFWEMGVNVAYVSKANTDFKKRTDTLSPSAQKTTTYVFVTPREWRDKDTWAAEKQKSTDWKRVVVFDANDLEHWIELCPSVDAWFSTIDGRRPLGILDLSSRWAALKSIAECELIPALFLAGRSAAQVRLRQWLADDPESLFLRAVSAEDALDFLTAWYAALPARQVDQLVAITSLDAWRTLAGSQDHLVMVAAPPLALGAEDVANAVRGGHHVLIVGTRSASNADDFTLPRLVTQDVQEALTSCGFDDAESRRVALWCAGSSTVLKRRLTTHASTRFPAWSNDEHGPSLAPLILVGGWHVPDTHLNEADSPFPKHTVLDMECLQSLLGLDPAQIAAIVTRWSTCDDPLLIRFGNAIVVGSREDAWYLLSRFLTPATVDRFEQLAMFVLDETDPSLELPPERRWLASLFGKTHSLSEDMRRGILESLVLMSVFPSDGDPSPIDFDGVVRRIVAEVLAEGATWETWATLDRHLQLLAEAAPDLLLDRIEYDLNQEKPELFHLFEEESGGLFSREKYIGLLWSLEVMAWSPEFLSRVSLVLGRMCDFEDALALNRGNRPSDSFERIFAPRSAFTNASVEQRVGALQVVATASTVRGWAVLRRLVPTGVGRTGHQTERPRWRNWAAGWSFERVNAELPRYCHALGHLLIDTAGDAPERWAELIDGVFMLTAGVTERAMERLVALSEETLDEHGKGLLWSRLREVVAHYRTSAYERMPEPYVERLEAIRDAIRPDDAVIRHSWLFTWHPVTEDVDVLSAGGEAALETLRVEAVREVVLGGWPQLSRLVEAAEHPVVVGSIVGRESLLSLPEAQVVELLRDGSERQKQFAGALVETSVRTSGIRVLETLRLHDVPVDDAARVLAQCPSRAETWGWIDENLGVDTARAYWRVWAGASRPSTHADALHVIEKLLDAGRPFTAALVLELEIRRSRDDVDPSLVARILGRGVTESVGEVITQSSAYSIRQLFGFLQEHWEDSTSLAALEWSYLELLDERNDGIRPSTLMQALSTQPDLYVELLRVVYRPDGGEESEDGEVAEGERERARLAKELLDAFDTLPGVGENGVIDSAALCEWIRDVRAGASGCDRRSKADFHIGKLLGLGAHDAGEEWPDALCEALATVGTDDVEEGFQNGLHFNGRVTWRRDDAGESELRLASAYRKRADEYLGRFPRMSRVLRGLARYLDERAKGERERAERRRLER